MCVGKVGEGREEGGGREGGGRGGGREGGREATKKDVYCAKRLTLFGGGGDPSPPRVKGRMVF